MQWYYAAGQESKGPLEEGDFRRLIADGTIGPETLIWHEGMADWLPSSKVPEAQVAAAAPTTPTGTANAASGTEGSGVCSECGRRFPTSDLLPYGNAMVCAACKGQFFQRLQEGVTSHDTLNYAGFWVRFGAKFVDNLILVMAALVILAAYLIKVFSGGSPANNPAELEAMKMTINGVVFALDLAYTVFFLGKFGATPGKMAFKLRVVRSDGSPLTYGRAFGRYFGDYLSRMILCIGYLMVAFDREQHRALHDHLCDTRVIHTN